MEVLKKEMPSALPVPQILIYAMLVFCLTSWGSSYIAMKVAVRHFEPHHIAVLRFVVASVVLAMFLPKAKPTMPTWWELAKLMVYGVTGIAVYNVLLAGGVRGVNAGTASFIIGIAPILAALLASLSLKERISRRGWIGLAVAFAGAAMMSASKASGFSVSAEIGMLLAAAMLSAVSITVQKSLLRTLTPLACTIYGVWAGTVLLLPFLPSAMAAAVHAPFHAVLWVVYLGVIPAAIGYICWAFILAHTPTGRAASFLYLVPAVAAAQSAMLLGESPSAWEIGGAAVIMLAVLGSTPNAHAKLSELMVLARSVLKESMRRKLLPVCDDCD